MRAGRDPRCRQGRLPALRNLADPDHRPRRAQRRRPGHPLCRPRSPAAWSARIAETDRRREKQVAYNARARHHARERSSATSATSSPTSRRRDGVLVETGDDERPHLVGHNLRAYIDDLEERMRKAAADLEFEEAGTPARRDPPAGGRRARHPRHRTRRAAPSGQFAREGKPGTAQGASARRSDAWGGKGKRHAGSGARNPMPCREFG